MRIERTRIPDVILIEPDVFRDARGFFLESFHQERYRKEAGIDRVFVQDNHAYSVPGALRGLHAQRRFAQGKLLRCVEGEVFDVAADVRRGSPTFGQWVGVVLSAENFRQLYVPPGFAHGYCVLAGPAQVEYKVTEYYHPEDEFGIHWQDPDLAIAWPLKEPLVSEKDARSKTMRELTDMLPRYEDAHEDPHHGR